MASEWPHQAGRRGSSNTRGTLCPGARRAACPRTAASRVRMARTAAGRQAVATSSLPSFCPLGTPTATRRRGCAQAVRACSTSPSPMPTAARGGRGSGEGCKGNAGVAQALPAAVTASPEQHRQQPALSAELQRSGSSAGAAAARPHTCTARFLQQRQVVHHGVARRVEHRDAQHSHQGPRRQLRGGGGGRRGREG